MATPDWLAATAGHQGNAGAITQFLGTHTSTWIYAGNTLQVSEATGSGLYVSTAGTYLAQEVTTGPGQTTIGSLGLQISAVGGSPITATIPPLQVSLYASASGLPTGSLLATTAVAEQTVYSAPFWLTAPLAVAGLTPSTPYVLTVASAGTSSAYYAWQRSNQSSGAATSPDGVTWTPQAYGLMFEVYDTSGTTGPPLYLIDDDGARVTALTYNSAGQLASITETTVAQGGTALYSQRALTYSNGLLIGVS
ncbi:MAG TPA: hypothetical protein VL595_23510 [Pseudonocardia sp.]|nr:hypothetical protein [Pseudonocardia sp.]